MKKKFQKFLSIVMTFFIIVSNISIPNVYATDNSRFGEVLVSDVGTNATIQQANTSRNLGVAPDGTIYVVYQCAEGIRIAKSSDNGNNFSSSVLVYSGNFEAEIAVSSTGIIYVLWVEGASAKIAKSIDGGTTFSQPKVVGNATGTVHMAVDGNYVYIIDRSGGNFYHSQDNGENFITYNFNENYAFSDVHINMTNHNVIVQKDNPSIKYYISTDYGNTFGPSIAPVGQSIFYSVGAISSGPSGQYLIIAGYQNNASRIDLNTGIGTSLPIGNNALPQGRSLSADGYGNVVTGYSNGTNVCFAVSHDYGQTYSEEEQVAQTNCANAAINPTNGDVLFLYEANGHVYLKVYSHRLVGYDLNVSNNNLYFNEDNGETEKDVEITNVSGQTMTINSINVEGENFTINPADNVTELVYDQSETLHVTFNPLGIGNYTSKITINYGNSDQEKIISLSGINMQLTDSEAVNIAKNSLDATDLIYTSPDNKDSITQNFIAPITGDNGTNISWETVSDYVYIDNQTGQVTVTRPTYIQGNQTVNLITTISKGEPAVTQQKTLTVTLKKSPGETNANISSLNLTGVTLTSQFNSNVTSYSSAVGYSTNIIILAPSLVDNNASIKINGSTANGTVNIPLNIGQNIITIEVTAQDGITKKTYTLNIKRSNGGGGSYSSAKTTTTPSITTTNNQLSTVDVLVNNQKQEGVATIQVNKESGKTVTTVVVDEQKLDKILQQQAERAIVIIPVDNKADVVVGQLNGQMVKNMEQKEAVVEIKTETATYTLPAQEIKIDDISEQIGTNVELKDIKIKIEIAKPSEQTVKVIESSAKKADFTLVAQPVEFNITCTNGSKTVNVSKFNGYVERTVAIPEGIDPSKITTGIVLNKDGTFSHVPTTVIKIDGKDLAKINSLTNSTYSVIYNPIKFADMESHWAKDDVNDMGSRLIIAGRDEKKFDPEADISRAEFATIVVKGLGLMRTGAGKDSYKDVVKQDWYYDAVSIANEYGIIKGYENGSFEPNNKITRKEAMVIMERAMKIIKIDTNVTSQEADTLLEKFADNKSVDSWAKQSVAACLKNEIIIGKDKGLQPSDNITRAETATIIMRMLEKSGLI